jgi:mono/diheme cytochrome c family protein
VKIALLSASGVTLLFLVAAMVRENFLSPWRHHQRAYRKMLLRSDDEQQRKLGEAFTVKIRQVDLPQLGTTDRCVSCHVGLDNPAMVNAKQPFRPHSGDHLKHHPVARYGCTICHQGQGVATNFREAKAADVHWDYPLLPARMTQASCGVCHAPDSALMAKHAPGLALGRQLFVERGCQSCHKLDGIGGQLGPALDDEGRKTKHQLPMAHVKGEPTLASWLTQHFNDPQHIVQGSQMRPPRLTAPENDALTIYMLSLRKRDLPQTYIAPDRIAVLNDSFQHKEMNPAILYNRFCMNCHGEGTYGHWDKFFNRFMPAVRGPGLRSVTGREDLALPVLGASTVGLLGSPMGQGPLRAASALFSKRTEYLKIAIAQGRPGTLMPAWNRSAGGLTEGQIDSLVEYLAKGDGKPAQVLRNFPKVQRGDGTRGRQLFSQLCAGCHGANQLAPSLGNSAFQKSASDEFILKTIANGRADTAMPAFQREQAEGLTDEELCDLLAYLRSLAPSK